MTTRTMWCDLTDFWLREHGTDVLDPLQRDRFVEHSRSCSKCASTVISDSSHLTHLSEATLAELADASARAQLLERVPDLETHLTLCDRCAGRLEVVSDLGGPVRDDGDADDDSLDDVGSDLGIATRLIARTRLVGVRWDANHSRLEWTADHPLLCRCSWLVDLAVDDGLLKATLVVDNPPIGWRLLAITLSSDVAFVGSLQFGPASRVCEMPISVPIDTTWVATATLCGDLPEWASVVSSEGGHEILRAAGPARPFALTIPRASSAEADLESQLVQLAEAFEDIHGRSPRLELGRTGATAGRRVAYLLTSAGGRGASLVVEVSDDALRVQVEPSSNSRERVWLTDEAAEVYGIAIERGSVTVSEIEGIITGAEVHRFKPAKGRPGLLRIPDLGSVDLKRAMADRTFMALRLADGSSVTLEPSHFAPVTAVAQRDMPYQLAAKELGDRPQTLQGASVDDAEAKSPQLFTIARYEREDVVFEILANAGGEVFVKF